MQTCKGRWCPLIVKLTVFGSVQPLILKLALEQTWTLHLGFLFLDFLVIRWTDCFVAACCFLFFVLHFHVAMLVCIADVVLQTVKPFFQLKHFNFDSISCHLASPCLFRLDPVSLCVVTATES